MQQTRNIDLSLSASWWKWNIGIFASIALFLICLKADEESIGFGDSPVFFLNTGDVAEESETFAASGFGDSAGFALNTGGDLDCGLENSGFGDSAGFVLNTTDTEHVSSLDTSVTAYCDSDGFILDTQDLGAGSDDNQQESIFTTGMQDIPGLGQAFVDADISDGAWVLVGYGGNGAFSGLLNTLSGTYDEARQGAATLNALEFIKSSPELAISWSQTGKPNGGIETYQHAVSFSFPDPSALTLTTQLVPPAGGGANEWSIVSTHASTVELDLHVLHGSPGLPQKMYARGETFGARYGGFYGFAWFAPGQFGHNQLDWGPDGQPINALYIGANGQPGYVASGAGGTQNGYTPSTMAIWARIPGSENEAVAETPGFQFPAGAIAHWTMDDVDGNKILDISSNQNDGTIFGDLDFVVEGRKGSAMTIVNGHINFGDIQAMDSPSAFSYSTWFNRRAEIATASNHDTNNVLIAQASSSDNDNFEVGTEGTKIEIYLDTAVKDTIQVDAGIQNNAWYHLAVTYDKDDQEGKQLRIYLNGELLHSSSQFRGNLTPSNSSALSLGVSRAANERWGQFNGLIDETALWTRALSSAEVRNLFDSYPSGPTSITLSNATIAENGPAGAVVGSLTLADPVEPATFTLSAYTSTASDAESPGEIVVSFLVDGVWSAELPFFSGVAVGEKKTKQFETSGYPTRVKLKSKTTNAWGFWMIVIDDLILLQDPNGPAGTAGPSVGPYWLETDGTEQVESILEIPEPAATGEETQLTAWTTNHDTANTGGTINVSFLIDGSWTTDQAFITSSALLATNTKTFTVSGQPSQFKLSTTSTDAWNYWLFSVDNRIILEDPKGTAGSAYGSNSYWLDRGDARAREEQIFDYPSIPARVNFALVSGAGDTDNAAFTIAGNELKLNAPADFEARETYSIRVQGTDTGGLSFTKAIVVTVTDVNEAPTNLALDTAAIAENGAAAAVVGKLILADPDGASEPVIITEGVGEKIWEFETGGFVESSPAIGSDGTVYVGSWDNKLYAINGNSGVKLWEFEMGGFVYSSPAIGPDGTVYVGSWD
ncbi:MAG: PQQ-binding-like beta-propeller repeat protein, partial [Opitutae bacterium]|nr:PQQ-binding-like beta-propeller repeat protein [Opitutae bacterium]